MPNAIVIPPLVNSAGKLTAAGATALFALTYASQGMLKKKSNNKNKNKKKSPRR
jgi:hypothetical protein